MSDSVILALAAGTGTWLLTALGAASALVFPRPGKKFLDGVLGFGAGVMIAASFWSLLQPAVAQARSLSLQSPWAVVTLGFLLGAGAMGAIGWFSPQESRLLLASVTLHNIPEGLAVGIAFGAISGGEGLAPAIAVALGIGIQNIPEGAAVSLPLFARGYSRSRSFLLGQGSGLVEPVSAVLGALMVGLLRPVLPWALAFAAGAMILVAFHELLPEGSPRSFGSTAGTILGFALMTLLDTMLG